jgi:curved DNA-binding protein CbpA
LYWAYQVLGVLPTATDREVHEAWRRRRAETHPDHAGSDPAEFERRSRLSCDINLARDIIVKHRHPNTRSATYAWAS